MKLATFATDAPRLGAIIPGTELLVDLARACLDKTGHVDPAVASMEGLIEAGERGLEIARTLLQSTSESECTPIGAVRLLPPLRPRALRCCSAFDGHHLGVAYALRKLADEPAPKSYEVPALFQAIPAYYKASHLNIAGPGDVIEWPSFGDDLDFELELAAVIGRSGRDVPAAQALNYIFGYTIFNDFSARKPQLMEMSMGLGPIKSKDFDGANVLGPFIVTKDELNGDDVLGIARIDGREIGRCRSSEMRHSWAQIIAYRSFGETIHPGEVITSGAFTSCSGIEHLRFLAPGEEIHLEIEGIGTLKNRIGDRPSRRIEWPKYEFSEIKSQS